MANIGFKSTAYIFRPIIKLILLGVKSIFTKVAFFVFKRQLWLKNKIKRKGIEKKSERFILVFTNRYIVHLLIIVISFIVSTSNIMAFENQENYGRNAMIYDLVGLDNIEILEDEVLSVNTPQIYSYLPQGVALENNPYTESQKIEDQIYQDQYDDQESSLQGGIALVKPELVSTEEAKITRKSVREHQIQSGENIGSIAAQYGISVNTLLWANNLSGNSIIKPGQNLVIPPTSGVLHKIVRGDTLIKIANKYEADIEQIKNFNNIDENDALAAGDTIMIPGGRIIYTPKPRTYVNTPTPTQTQPAPNYSIPNVAAGGKMYWPSSCSRISQYYRGWLHTGVDIACGYGKEIRAAEAGKVSRVQYITYGYGYNVIIDHGGGKQTLYAHLSRIYVENGQSVKKGEVIALEGSTGRSTGPHLHFEVIINGNRLNPLNYLR